MGTSVRFHALGTSGQYSSVEPVPAGAIDRALLTIVGTTESRGVGAHALDLARTFGAAIHLLAVGARARTPTTDRLLGSTTGRLLDLATLPVLSAP